MAVELVTGYAGKAHVTSSEDGARQAGTVGTGMYALETVDEPLKATLENANTVTVGPGDVLINGRHVQLTGSTTFAVPVGTQGMQTSNLLVLRYELAEGGTESVTAITLTGEAAASDPSDPELATGSVLDGDSPVDMPLYRVVTTGIESAQPVRLFETVPPIAGLTLGGLPGSLTSDQLPVVPVSKGGTGATSAADARTALGLGALATLGSPLPVANGGTGMTSNPSMLTNLGSTSAAGVFQGSPRPGITGTLAVGHGGTGATSATAARNSLGAAKLLWSGTLSRGGKISSAEFANYDNFIFQIAGCSVAIARGYGSMSGHLVGMGGSLTTSTAVVAGCNMTISGTTISANEVWQRSLLGGTNLSADCQAIYGIA